MQNSDDENAGRWDALNQVLYVQALRFWWKLCVKSENECIANSNTHTNQLNQERRSIWTQIEKERTKKKWKKTSHEETAKRLLGEKHTHTFSVLVGMGQTTTRSWEKLEQLKWHTIEFNSFMHCINYQLIIIIVDDTASFFLFLIFIIRLLSVPLFVRSFVCLLWVCCVCVYFSLLFGSLLFYSSCLSSPLPLYSFVSFYVFVIVYSSSMQGDSSNCKSMIWENTCRFLLNLSNIWLWNVITSTAHNSSEVYIRT